MFEKNIFSISKDIVHRKCRRENVSRRKTNKLASEM